MKKIIVLSVLAISLSGCVIDPYYDDEHRHRDRYGHHDRDYDDRDHDDWDWRDRDGREWRRDD